MSFFSKLFGGKATPPAAQPPTAPAAPAEGPDKIRVFDPYGREMFITREQWRSSVLPGTLQRAWNNPDELYGFIVNALNDGFYAEVYDAAKHLVEIDPDPARSACIWGNVLMKTGRLAEAEAVYREHTAKHGEDGLILTNLAKVLAARGDQVQAEAVLWRGLQLDPNLDNAGSWYQAIHRERGGEAGVSDALQRLAALPGSWRAQLWLARASLQKRDLPGAIALYSEALSRAVPAPADLLMQISGDLGNAGHLLELIGLVELSFQPANHGMQVGNNLIKAHLDLGQLDAAHAILDQLYALKRPDWTGTLSYWDTELAKARVGVSPPVAPEALRVILLAFDAPLWLTASSPAAELFPAKIGETVRIAFLGGSAEAPDAPAHAERQLADTQGRLSRSIPLFLAEQAAFGSNARAQTLVSWLDNDAGGFILSGQPWSDAQAAESARSGPVKNDYVVCTHLKAGGENWVVQARVIRTIDGTCVGSTEGAFAPAEPTEGVQSLSCAVATILEREAEIQRQEAPGGYDLPTGLDLAVYLLRLEQLLAVRCAALSVSHGKGNFLNGEREILDGNLRQCLEWPACVTVRTLMAQTFLTMKRVRPEILAEFKERIEMLQRDHPLLAPAQGVIQRVLNDAMAVG